jgi:hypothetical protein
VFHPAAAFGGSDSEDSEGEGADSGEGSGRRKARNPSFSDDFVAMGPSASAVDVDAVRAMALLSYIASYS